MFRMAWRDLPIVPATAGDAQAIAVMSRDLVELGLGWEYRREPLAGMIAERDTCAIVPRDGARVAGFAIMTFGHERGHLVLLAVRPSHQRCGIARRMLAWHIETAVWGGGGGPPAAA